MEIIDLLSDENIWNDFLLRKESQGTIARRELDYLRSFIAEKKYLPVAESLIRGEYSFPLPQMKEINRISSGKKRIVFTFPEEYSTVLKLIAYLLHRYDSKLPCNLYSFKEHTGVKKAVRDISTKVKLDRCYTYKADVHDYFNSIDARILIPKLRELLVDEPKLMAFFDKLFSEPRALFDGVVIETKKGAMAGLAVSSFMANIYLTEMDEFFEKRKIPYIRYSDDVIVFAETEEEIKEYEEYVKKFICGKGLSINKSKEVRTVPGEPIEFLGFRFEDGRIDVSRVSLMKLKGKMKRRARKIYRWKLRKGVDNEAAIRLYIRFLNQKFYDNPIHEEITWSRWFFPVLTTDRSLRVIDGYAVDCIRYIATGRYGKKNYNIRYEDIRRMGYRSLVKEFWKGRDNLCPRI